jgi:carbon monoxide dehydrogenase subunit G
MIRLTSERTIDAPADAVFALAVDPERFPILFAGCGPVPALRRITLHGPLAVGSTRELESSDGSRLVERVTALDAPRRHAYSLSGIRAPLGWLVRAGHADWTFEAAGSATRVRWSYDWEPTGWLARPFAWLLLRCFMRTAMQRCLAAMQSRLSIREARR